MSFEEIKKRAVEIQAKYAELEKKKYGKNWDVSDLTAGLVGDVGDLSKLVMAKKGIREVDNLDEKLAHELSDCLWSVIVLADKLGVDLEIEFIKTMQQLEDKISGEFA